MGSAVTLYQKGDFVVHVGARDETILIIGESPAHRPAKDRQFHVVSVDPRYPDSVNKEWWCFESECRPVKAFIAEDDPVLGPTLKAMFEGAIKAEITLMTTAQEVIDCIDAGAPHDAILTEITFTEGVKTGYDVLTHSRDNQPLTPIFGMGEGTAASPPDGYEFNMYEQKPFNLLTFMQDLGEVVGFVRY